MRSDWSWRSGAERGRAIYAKALLRSLRYFIQILHCTVYYFQNTNQSMALRKKEERKEKEKKKKEKKRGGGESICCLSQWKGSDGIFGRCQNGHMHNGGFLSSSMLSHFMTVNLKKITH